MDQRRRSQIFFVAMKEHLIRTLVVTGPPLLGFLILPDREGIASFVAYEVGLFASAIARRSGIEIDFSLKKERS